MLLPLGGKAQEGEHSARHFPVHSAFFDKTSRSFRFFFFILQHIEVHKIWSFFGVFWNSSFRKLLHFQHFQLFLKVSCAMPNPKKYCILAWAQGKIFFHRLWRKIWRSASVMRYLSKNIIEFTLVYDSKNKCFTMLFSHLDVTFQIRIKFYHR